MCGKYMFRAILQKIVFCCINEDLLHPVYGSLLYCGISLLWCIWNTFIVLCIDVVIFLVLGSLDKTMLNLKLRGTTIGKMCLFYEGLQSVRLFMCCEQLHYLHFGAHLVRAFFPVSCLVYILSRSCRIQKIIQSHDMKMMLWHLGYCCRLQDPSNMQRQ